MISELIQQYPDLMQRIMRLEVIQGHSYLKKELAAEALLHRSALTNSKLKLKDVNTNERLEFLGDSFLNFQIALFLSHRFPEKREGELSKLRASLVGTESLAKKAENLGLPALLLKGRHELFTQKQAKLNAFADLFEAVLAALMLDAGEQAAKSWLLNVFHEELASSEINVNEFDVKTQLQEWVQSHIGEPPEYRMLRTIGYGIRTEYEMAAYVGSWELGCATAASKKEATKKVAQQVFEKIQSGEITAEMLKKVKSYE